MNANERNFDRETQSMRHQVGLYCECDECTGAGTMNTNISHTVRGDAARAKRLTDTLATHAWLRCSTCGRGIWFRLPTESEDGVARCQCGHAEVFKAGLQLLKNETHEIITASLALLALALIPHTAHAAPEYQRPLIGTAAYDRSCTITQSWEDGAAYAYCTEDGAWYVYDPDGKARLVNGVRVVDALPGWEPMEEPS